MLHRQATPTSQEKHTLPFYYVKNLCERCSLSVAKSKTLSIRASTTNEKHAKRLTFLPQRKRFYPRYTESTHFVKTVKLTGRGSYENHPC